MLVDVLYALRDLALALDAAFANGPAAVLAVFTTDPRNIVLALTTGIAVVGTLWLVAEVKAFLEVA